MRKEFFGPQGDTSWNRDRLQATQKAFRHHELDIRERERLLRTFAVIKPSAIVHTAAQPETRLGSGAAIR